MTSVDNSLSRCEVCAKLALTELYVEKFRCSECVKAFDKSLAKHDEVYKTELIKSRRLQC